MVKQYQGCVHKQAWSQEQSSCHTYCMNEEWPVIMHVMLLLTNMVLQHNINGHFPILGNREILYCVIGQATKVVTKLVDRMRPIGSQLILVLRWKLIDFIQIKISIN